MNVLKPHVSLNVSNVDASVAFYEKVFGVARDEAPPRVREVRPAGAVASTSRCRRPRAPA